MKGIEGICFQIICAVGNARSLYIEAIQEAKQKNFEKAEQLIAQGEASFVEGHKAHADLIAQEASGTSVQVNLLLAHAEDQLMSAEGFGILSKEFIDIYRQL